MEAGAAQVPAFSQRRMMRLAGCRKTAEVVEIVDGIYFDMLVDVIDNKVEKTADYKKRVEREYSLSPQK